jgi:hypothetical protein
MDRRRLRLLACGGAPLVLESFDAPLVSIARPLIGSLDALDLLSSAAPSALELRQISRQGWGIKDVLAKSLPLEAPGKRRGQDAYSAFCDFGNRNGFGSRAGAGSGLRSKFPGLPAIIRPRWRQHRLQLYNAASVQSVGIGHLGAMLHQSFFCERARARGLSAASPRLLTLIL